MDWGSETTTTSSEFLETALGHTIKSKIEYAYRRGIWRILINNGLDIVLDESILLNYN